MEGNWYQRSLRMRRRIFAPVRWRFNLRVWELNMPLSTKFDNDKNAHRFHERPESYSLLLPLPYLHKEAEYVFIFDCPRLPLHVHDQV